MSATASERSVAPARPSDGTLSRRVAMVGAGQLARMTHQAAIDYGVEVIVLADHLEDPAVDAGAANVLRSSDIEGDLRALVQRASVLTFDHELVDLPLLQVLEEEGYLLRPSPRALRFACDKIYARRTLAALGDPLIALPKFTTASSIEAIEAFVEHSRWPIIAKSASGGYDGRGVHTCNDPAEACELLSASGDKEWLIEEHLDLAAEFALLLARSPSGELAVYPPIGTTQHDGICRELTMPADLPAAVIASADKIARSVITTINATGICAVEFFLTRDGRLLLNEFALRPHNSGHATIEACHTSQFHQHLRAVLDWPLGSTELIAPAATVNLIAVDATDDPRSRLHRLRPEPGVHIHLYQKEPRPGRKVGHVTALGDSVEEALARARRTAQQLSDEQLEEQP